MSDVKIPKKIYDLLVNEFVFNRGSYSDIEAFMKADYKKRCDRIALDRAFAEKAQAKTEEEKKAAEDRIGELMKVRKHD